MDRQESAAQIRNYCCDRPFFFAEHSLRSYVASLSLGLAALTALTTACDAGPQLVDHSFEFNAFRDSPGVEILDYRYGDSKVPGASNPDYRRKEGKSAQQTSITGLMRRPDMLYVKWRVVKQNKIYEDTVDLRERLPKEITNSIVYFRISEQQLYVYLITDRSSPPDSPPNGPPKYHHRTVITIYPDTP